MASAGKAIGSSVVISTATRPDQGAIFSRPLFSAWQRSGQVFASTPFLLAHRRLTNLGRWVAVLFTETYGRILGPGLSAFDPHLPEEVTAGNHLSTARRCFEKAL